MRLSRPLALVLATCFVGSGLAACEGKPGAPDQPAVLAVGAPAPAFAGTTVRGEPLSLADLRGRVVLLNVWATWCEPCREELPELEKLHTSLGPRGLTVLGVSIDAARDAPTLRDMIASFGLHYPVIHDERNIIGAPFKIIGYPASFVIDRAGVLRWRRDGLLQPGDPELAAVLEAALSE
jgi:peroxiredoxin